ncbi:MULTISPECIES: hypothetical protein [unclassified Mesorhizobium]|uniref:hypothetical protein n=1 Tax=unclassified Mesorhizobium TaxID=325217 RepID=UPI001FDEA5E6|nr:MULTISPECIES: hypothetical protein [unclassified Mesorhizobium]
MSMEKQGFVSRVHRKKPKGRLMPETTRRANNIKSKVRSRVEHVFTEQKSRMGLFIRTIGIARATTKVGMANLAYHIKRLKDFMIPGSGQSSKESSPIIDMFETTLG